MKKTTWNYRVIKMPDFPLVGKKQTYSFGIYEVYYTKDKPHSWSEEPMHPGGESYFSLIKDFSHMQNAFSGKVLELKNGKLIECKNPFQK